MGLPSNPIALLPDEVMNPEVAGVTPAPPPLMARAPAPMAAPPPPVLPSPVAPRPQTSPLLNILRGIMGQGTKVDPVVGGSNGISNLLFALGQGMQAAGEGKYPGSFLRGMGASLSAPMTIQQMNLKNALAQAQAENYNSTILHRIELERQAQATNEVKAKLAELVPVDLPNADGTTSQVLVPAGKAGEILARAKANIEANKSKETVAEKQIASREKVASQQIASREAIAKMNSGKIDPAIAAMVGEKPERLPNDTDESYRQRMQAWGQAVYAKQLEKLTTPGVARMMVLTMNRVVTTMDPDNPGNVLYTTVKDALGQSAAGKPNVSSVMSATSLVNDMKRAAKYVGQVTDVLDEPADRKTLIAGALAEPDATAEKFLQSGVRDKLTDREQQYVIGVLGLREQAMALRTVLKQGQGSEMQRMQILATIPGVSPNSGFARRQLEQFDALLNTVGVGKGIPQIPGINAPGNQRGMVTMKGPKGTYSVPASQIPVMKQNGYSVVGQ